MEKPLMASYSRLPVAFSHGQGAWLWDQAGKKYLDAISSIAVCNLGHAHEAVTRAICEQAGRLIHTSNLYRIPVQEQLAARLTSLAGMDNAFFCNSGAEANEAALKIARLYGHKEGIETPMVVVMEGSFHGRTLATLSATGNRKIQAGFEPLVQGFVRVPYNDVEALIKVARNCPGIVAVLLEPVQGEGGVVVPAPGYLAQVRAVCDAHGWLLMLDEVQAGLGRTGKWFACQHEGVVPDVMTLAKALGNGVPIGACLAQGEAAELIQPGKHASTFGGNPLACRAALAVLDTLESQGLVARAAELGEALLGEFCTLLAGRDGIKDIRGKGLMIGIELAHPCRDLVEQALNAGILINVTAERVVRLLPPLILADREAQQIVEQVAELITGFLAAGPGDQ